MTLIRHALQLHIPSSLKCMDIKFCKYFVESWLVGCFRLNGPLRQYFSLSRVLSQREGEEKRNDRRE